MVPENDRSILPPRQSTHPLKQSNGFQLIIFKIRYANETNDAFLANFISLSLSLSLGGSLAHADFMEIFVSSQNST